MGEGVAIEAHGLRKRYGDVVALEEVDLRVEAGSILGLLGPNGAGKRSLAQLERGIVAPYGTRLLPPTGKEQV